MYIRTWIIHKIHKHLPRGSDMNFLLKKITSTQ